MLKPIKSELTRTGRGARYMVSSLSLDQLFAVAVTMAIASVVAPGWGLIALPIAIASAWFNGKDLHNERFQKFLNRISKSNGLVKATWGRAPALAPIGLMLMVLFVVTGLIFGAG